jgi:hypothetical protein
MSQQLTISGKFLTPIEDSTVTAAIDMGVVMPYTARADFSRKYDSAVTADPVSLGTLTTAGAKAVLVKCILGTCTITFNGGSDAWPLAASPAGFLLWCNTTQGYLTSAAVTTSGAATVIFVALG